MSMKETNLKKLKQLSENTEERLVELENELGKTQQLVDSQNEIKKIL